ncbi:ent-copalyl diphosphate/ent-kaurene synthase [Boeremia exigua]|uniref:ent-copalyl diphosphate/ent-kaurene synthase n=1 Tax=Boeremia exigua TaxID=749465 RepID=UPI001E8EEAAC|nr:ent-copalyl diphosphate/ent-kaurene synthase [Boeremia exigua]KAH6625504.1 ent-copalyl diphosphate/ent-kaurene synthase [Boeremia exigua]
MIAHNDQAAKGRSLIQRIFKSYDAQYGQSSASIQVYDTAWVAMVTKTVDGKKKWAFPESFDYLLRAQLPDGNWSSHSTSQTVGILDTSAALLALLRHLTDPLQIDDVSSEAIRKGADSAINSLRSQLEQWNDVFDTNHIGVELIVPALLEYLEAEGLFFEFQSKKMLLQMHAAKLARFKLESVYGPTPSTALHSLEAFIGKIDFDKVAHHIFRGSMLASPSSTAAYLTHASSWDDGAERYLRHIIKEGMGHGDGSVAGTYPITYFEYSWTISTLLRSGFTVSDLECPALHGMAQVLLDGFKEDRGIIGFAPRAVDVDDTAKGLLALRLLEKTEGVSPKVMIKVFERADHFTTFGSERDPSFTSHCHVLLALLAQENVAEYAPQIEKAVKFMCNAWWTSDYRIKDKWHLSHLYPTMLLVQAFTDVLALVDRGELLFLNENLRWQISISLFQACHRTLLEQRQDGSWSEMPEQTAYAILALAEARRVCFFSSILPALQASIDRAITFLKDSPDHWAVDHNWTSKTAYNVRFVAEAYILAATNMSSTVGEVASIGTSLGLGISTGELDAYQKLVSKTPLFASLPDWEVRTSLIESALFVPLLKARRLDVFPRDKVPITKDTYFTIIPFTWVGCNNRSRTFASALYLYEMMHISLLGFQTDEFVEVVLAPAFEDDISGLHDLIDRVIDNIAETSQHKNGVTKTNGRVGENGIHETDGSTTEKEDIVILLSRFAEHVLHHPSVLEASRWDRENLRSELKTFLHAHTTQVGDNKRFAAQLSGNADEDDTYNSPGRSFFQWLHSTAADHVACAYSLAFSTCLISASLGKGDQVFDTVMQKHLAAVVSRHASVLNRLYNDYGSLGRDTTERNVNSMHFPEFATYKGEAAKKQALVALAELESRGLEEALRRLEYEVGWTEPDNLPRAFDQRKVDILKFFCNVAGFYDQLYMVRDLSSAKVRAT